MIPASRRRNTLQSGLYVAIVAVLAAVLLERLLTYAEAYEKAQMEVTVSRLHSGLYTRLAYLTLRGERQVAETLQEESPFAVIDWRPPQYLGEFYGAPPGEASGWYFDRVSRELVYRPNLKRHFLAPDPPAARFRVKVQAGVSVRLEPVEAIRWEPVP